MPELQMLARDFKAVVSDQGRFILADVDGKPRPITIEEYKERIAEKLVAEASNLGQFRERWIAPRERRDLLGQLPAAGQSPIVIRAVTYKHAAWLAALPKNASGTLAALISQFGHSGTDALESTKISRCPTSSPRADSPRCDNSASPPTYSAKPSNGSSPHEKGGSKTSSRWKTRHDKYPVTGKFPPHNFQSLERNAA